MIDFHTCPGRRQVDGRLVDGVKTRQIKVVEGLRARERIWRLGHFEDAVAAALKKRRRLVWSGYKWSCAADDGYRRSFFASICH